LLVCWVPERSGKASPYPLLFVRQLLCLAWLVRHALTPFFLCVSCCVYHVWYGTPLPPSFCASVVVSSMAGKACPYPLLFVRQLLCLPWLAAGLSTLDVLNRFKNYQGLHYGHYHLCWRALKISLVAYSLETGWVCQVN
jgi:hypothetical protein